MPTTKTQFDEVARNSRHLPNRIAFPLQTFGSANLHSSRLNHESFSVLRSYLCDDLQRTYHNQKNCNPPLQMCKDVFFGTCFARHDNIRYRYCNVRCDVTSFIPKVSTIPHL
jgi:hypothetical protein